MSDEEKPSEERTEQASSKRKQQAEDQGDLPLGRDLGMLGGMAAGSVTLYACAGALRDSLVRLTWAMGDGLARANPRDLIPYLGAPTAIVLLVCAATAVGASIPMLAQTKMQIWGNLAMPNFQRVFSGGRLKRLFGMEMAADMGLAFVKVVAVGWACWSVFRDEFVTLPRMLTMSTGAELSAAFMPMANGLAKILTSLAVVAGLDLAVTRYRYAQKMKMTREEAKRDYKEEEGDPMFRMRRKRQHRELIKNRVAIEVPKADALIVNPTHIAIAIRYRPGEDAAPRVTAKGKGQLAETMRELARFHGIPIVEDIPLARLLYKRVKVGRQVPAETFKAVAAVLAFVYRVLGRQGGNTIQRTAGGRQ